MSEWLQAYRENHADFDQPSAIGALPNNPFVAFSEWFDTAVTAKEREANACVLSTCGHDLQASSRVLYLKELLDNQFIFYTNYSSQKGQELHHNPKASLLFFWPQLMRQVRIEGSVQQIDPAISDAYFASRPRESQLGAWASQQSETLSDRAALIARFEAFDRQFPDAVPRPPHWGGFALQPHYMEFWQGQPSRLHERRIYEFSQNEWTSKLLNP
ncbi:MAG: pyridoxamine 5'-phosphate oxidase [Crocinitomicaceae bacterium]|nr:pyridoxamine 5'-phosphate oxidase [Crocinitomicaceae bacterium]